MERAVVGVTDTGWADFLRERPRITEVNFWFPSVSTGFKALRRGDPFLFKAKWAAGNRIIGGGFFSDYCRLRVSEAWRFFGEGNGVASHDVLRAKIAAYRAKNRGAPDPDPEIGCVLLSLPFFVDDADSLAGPPDFGKAIVRFKGYELAAGSYVERAFAQLIDEAGVRAVGDDGEPTIIPGPVYRKDWQEVQVRTRQSWFRAAVTLAYDRRCAVTGNRVVPVLQAAHIRPVAEEGENRVDNGLLLRSDVHILYDAGYLGVDQRRRLHVSPRLRADFGNGEEFYSKAGAELSVLPGRAADRPAAEALEWHMDTKFLVA